MGQTKYYRIVRGIKRTHGIILNKKLKKEKKRKKCTSFGTEMIVCDYRSRARSKYKVHTYIHF